MPRPTTILSGGWRQRLSLGCSIIHNPRVVFLDEPTAGVDPISRRDFWSLIKKLSDNGITIFVTTHYMGEVENCNRISLIYNGRVIALGAPKELKEKYNTPNLEDLFVKLIREHNE